jgi:hypothetical protein
MVEYNVRQPSVVVNRLVEEQEVIRMVSADHRRLRGPPNRLSAGA